MDYRQMLEDFGQPQGGVDSFDADTGFFNSLTSMDASGTLPDFQSAQPLEMAPASNLQSAAEDRADNILNAALQAGALQPVSTADTGAGSTDADDSHNSAPVLARLGRSGSGSDPGSASQQEDSYSFDGEGDSSSGEEDGDERQGSSHIRSSSGRRRRRRNILPRIMKGQRCGHCHTCLNPQMKKACLTMRQKQMEEMRKRGELPVSLLTQVSSDGAHPKSGTVPPAVKPATKRGVDFAGLEQDKQKKAATQADLDPFTREIQAIANRKGGVEPRSLASLQRLYQQESSLERRLVLMTILKQSPASTLKEAVRNQIVIVELQKWLLAAAESKDFRLAYRVIETLDKLPIDLTALQSTGIGRSMAKLRKAGPEDLRKGADTLVTKWKKAVDGDAAAKRPRESSSDAGGGQGSSKKLKPSETAAKSAKPKTELPRQSSVDFTDGSRGRASVPMEVDDNAMFERKKAVPSLKDSVFQMKRAHQIKILSEDASKKLKSQEGGEGSGSPQGKSGEAAAGKESGADGEAAKEEPFKLGSRPPPSAFASAPLSMPLGSSRLSGVGSGITRIGGAGSSLSSLSLSAYDTPMDAASRAAAAAARVPEPPSQPKKEKAKKVSWTSDDHLVLVRWFRQADPVVAVREDAKETTEVGTGAPATAEEAHPPGFVSAAKREHQNEAAALRQHRLDVREEELAEEAERSPESGHASSNAAPDPGGHAGPSAAQPSLHWAQERRLPMIEWPVAYQGPPFVSSREREYGIPTDEERQTPGFQEVAHMIASQPAAVYATPALAPHTPLEPPSDASMPITPLSIPCPRMEPAPAVPDVPQLAPQPLPQAGPQPTQPQHLPQRPSGPLPPPVRLPPPVVLPAPQAAPRPQLGGHASLPMAATPAAFSVAARPPVAQEMRPSAPAFTEGGRGYPGRGRGRGRQGQGHDMAGGPESGGRGRTEGRGGRGGRRPPEGFSGRGGRRKPGEAPRPSYLVPCKWHFGGQGCKNGESCRFSHNAEHAE